MERLCGEAMYNGSCTTPASAVTAISNNESHICPGMLLYNCSIGNPSHVSISGDYVLYTRLGAPIICTCILSSQRTMLFTPQLVVTYSLKISIIAKLTC